jgi:hypothetical protein
MNFNKKSLPGQTRTGRVSCLFAEIQGQIAELIKKSFYLCGESKRLLDNAKDVMEKEMGRMKNIETNFG